EGDETWIVESSGNTNLGWLSLPRLLTSPMIPFYYVRNKSNDELVVQAKRLQILGERSSWRYQTLAMPGAGVMKVNLGSGNLHYEMEDASFPARVFDDQIKRAYESHGMALKG